MKLRLVVLGLIAKYSGQDHTTRNGSARTLARTDKSKCLCMINIKIGLMRICLAAGTQIIANNFIMCLKS